MPLGGHLRTVGTLLRRRLRRPWAPPSEPWETRLEDPELGPVGIRGRLSRGDGDRLLVALHGLGGSADSRYLWELAVAAVGAGWSVLRLSLRGADRRGEDFYHGGLTADLHAALAAPDLAGFVTVAVAGYSLGGHTTLRYAAEPGDARVAAVAAVCAPVDLAAGQRAIDRPGAALYRRYVMAHLKDIYRQVAQRHPEGGRAVPIAVSAAEGIRTLLEWDERIVAPRHGFAGAADYYARASVASRLGELRVPVLAIHAEDDPMVPVTTVRIHLDPPPPGVETRWVPGGGHVAFPRDLDLGLGPAPGLAPQLVAWLGG
jgi:predicted alpha/beta-fold hydrolase